MQVVHPQQTPPATEPQRPSIKRRVLAVAFGLASIGLVWILLLDREDGYIDETVYWIVLGPPAVAFGAGAAVLWQPKGRARIGRVILFTALAGAIIAVGIILFALAG
jgi:peptidoglycan/LPS O-acetylase OafA/YrhL